METLSELVYSPLKEEENLTEGWSKDTIDYAIENKRKLFKAIRGVAKSKGRTLLNTDIEDIYQTVLNYLYRCDDYKLEKAYTDKTLVSLEGYVHTCAKYCAIRYVTDAYAEERIRMSDITFDDEGKELSIFDTIADEKSNITCDDIGYDLREICKQFESHRYGFGPDIFMLWFIRLQTIIHHKEDRYKDILNILGVSRKELNEIERKTYSDGAMLSIAKAVSIVGINEAIKVLRDFTYSYKNIEAVVNLF